MTRRTNRELFQHKSCAFVLSIEPFRASLPFNASIRSTGAESVFVPYIYSYRDLTGSVVLISPCPNDWKTSLNILLSIFFINFSFIIFNFQLFKFLFSIFRATILWSYNAIELHNLQIKRIAVPFTLSESRSIATYIPATGVQISSDTSHTSTLSSINTCHAIAAITCEGTLNSSKYPNLRGLFGCLLLAQFTLSCLLHHIRGQCRSRAARTVFVGSTHGYSMLLWL